MQPVVITGKGIVCAIGHDEDSVATSLMHRQSGIGEMRYLQSVHHELPVGEVKLSNAEMKQLLGIDPSQRVSRTALMGMMAVRQAVSEAKVQADGRRRIVLISGTTVAGMDITEQVFGQMVANGVGDECLDHHDCGSNTADIARYFNLFDDYTTISTACSSAANALELGADMLKAGDADIVVAGGTEALSKFHLNGFNALMILDHAPCRPFDKSRAGLNLGEGAAYVVLERQTDAEQRGAHIDAYLSGYGNACDAFHQTATSPDGLGAQLAMREALTMAGLKPADIQWVHAHGTGTVNNDESESRAIRQVFSDAQPPVSSTKGFTGHTTSASGSIAAVIAIIAMYRRFIPVNLGWSQPMEDGLSPYMQTAPIDLHAVMVNSFGFGGNDSSLILTDQPTATKQPDLKAEADIVELTRVENDSLEATKRIRQYVSPMESRRMGKLMKSAMLTSLDALKQAGVSCPDAIVTGTAWGCLENSEQLLLQLIEGEDLFKPTLFMQSTHNTLSSAIAIHLKCHGANLTFTQKEQSFDWALYQAKLLLRLGRAKTVLVGCHDERTALFNRFLGQEAAPVRSTAVVLTI
ncbi:MAG: beta-ketoacyl-[acyl-carrier-protein] synthase family protein [Prevotella sp.]|nr:beta-ketoacyl-[acyl-carrier-protein] synthase family protein [Prevotella sp.]